MKRLFTKGLALTLSTVFMLMSLVIGNAGLAADSQSGLIAQYKFDDDFRDSSGSGNDGVSVGNVSFSDGGVTGKCAVFEGGYIQIPSSTSLNLGSAFTLSAWVKLDTDDTGANLDGTIVAKENNDKENLLNNYSYHFITSGIHGV
ncbi:MAG: hypothetical protein Q8878_05425, partial [Bacillota bacterium]|nr:hypothetical protein [Bacillota bacterium]